MQKKIIIAIATACLTLAITGCKPEHWPTYGRDLKNTRSNPVETVISPQSVTNLRPLWATHPKASGVTSTPVIPDDYLVYYGNWDGDVEARFIETGALLWRTRQSALPVSASIAASPMLIHFDTNHDGTINKGERILPLFAADGDGFLHALNRLTGEIKWSTKLDPHPDTNIFGSPVLWNGHLFIGVSSIEVGMDKEDYTFAGSVASFDPATGAEQWRFYTNRFLDGTEAGAGVSVWSSPAIDRERELLFIGTGNSYEQPAGPISDSLLALNANTGEYVWHRQFTVDDVFTIPRAGGPDADIGASPILYAIGEQDVVMAADKAGRVAVFNRETGSMVWTIDALQMTGSDVSGSHLGGIMASPAYANGTLFVVSNFWGADFDLELPIDPANTSAMFGIDAATGAVLWETVLGAPSFGAVSHANGVVFIGTLDGKIHALDAVSGAKIWSDKPARGMPKPIGGGSAISNGRLFTGFGFSFFTVAVIPPGGLKVYALRK